MHIYRVWRATASLERRRAVVFEKTKVGPNDMHNLPEGLSIPFVIVSTKTETWASLKSLCKPEESFDAKAVRP